MVALKERGKIGELEEDPAPLDLDVDGAGLRPPKRGRNATAPELHGDLAGTDEEGVVDARRGVNRISAGRWVHSGHEVNVRLVSDGGAELRSGNLENGRVVGAENVAWIGEAFRGARFDFPMTRLPSIAPVTAAVTEGSEHTGVRWGVGGNLLAHVRAPVDRGLIAESP